MATAASFSKGNNNWQIQTLQQNNVTTHKKLFFWFLIFKLEFLSYQKLSEEKKSRYVCGGQEDNNTPEKIAISALYLIIQFFIFRWRALGSRMLLSGPRSYFNDYVRYFDFGLPSLNFPFHSN